MNDEKYTMEQLGDEATRRQVLNHFNDSRSGGFAVIHGYEQRTCNCGKGEDGTPCQNPDHIEVADHYIQFGVNYGRIKERDIQTLTAIKNGERRLSVSVKYGVWLDEKGEAHTKQAKGRVYSMVEIELDMTDERLRTAVADVLKSLEQPKQASVEYDKKGKGAYEYDGRLYVRDALAVHKVVRREGEWPKSASSQDVAIRNAVKKTLLTGRYRAFVFDGRFEFITVSGKAIVVDGLNPDFYFVAPEVAKAVVAGVEFAVV